MGAPHIASSRVALENGVEISEVVAVEERTEDLAYLLAGVSVRRIADPLRRSDTQSTIARIRRLRDQPETDC